MNTLQVELWPPAALVRYEPQRPHPQRRSDHRIHQGVRLDQPSPHRSEERRHRRTRAASCLSTPGSFSLRGFDGSCPFFTWLYVILVFITLVS